jgi:methylmalonyl-CoA mutase
MLPAGVSPRGAAIRDDPAFVSVESHAITCSAPRARPPPGHPPFIPAAMSDLEAGELALAAEFPAATRQQWQRLVARVLGREAGPGDAPERELATVTADGIEIAPLYVAGDGQRDTGFPGQAPFTRGRSAAGHRAGWDVRPRHEHPDPAVAREQVMADLEGGASSLWLGLGDGQIPLPALPEVLSQVYLDLAAVVLDAGERFTEAAEVFLLTATRRGVPAPALTGCLGADPLAVLARTGAEASLEAAADLARRCSAELPGMRAIVVDATAFHDAGATDAQELGCALAAGTEYLRAMRAAGLAGPAAAGQLEFRYAATADQFATIAKLRAGRRAWARVVEQCGIPASVGGQRQHAVTSWPMLTRRDPWNNILRATLACFAAGAGGADAISVTPFDAAIGQPDQLARRVARNIHALLAEESHVASVIDPAGGSWYVEDLTEQLAIRGWACFQEIERAGGLHAALASGSIAGQLAASRQARRDALARRREAITGVSEFPLAGEVLLTRPPGPPPGRPAGLPRIRWAQWHEELRDRADAHARATGAPPTVTLALLDASRASAAQAGQVAALLAPAGIAAVTAGPLASGPARAAVVVVCGSGPDRPEQARAAAEQARSSGAATVVMADEVLSGDLDLLAFSGQLLAALGVE